MDEQRFDAWTRRRFGFGLAASGVVASFAGLIIGADEVSAKKNRKRQRKRKTCKPNQTRCGKKTCVKGDCCPGKSCGEDCACRRTVEGRTFCVRSDLPLVCEGCASNADCDAPRRCMPVAGCPTAVCFPPCGFTG